MHFLFENKYKTKIHVTETPKSIFYKNQPSDWLETYVITAVRTVFYVTNAIRFVSIFYKTEASIRSLDWYVCCIQPIKARQLSGSIVVYCFSSA